MWNDIKWAQKINRYIMMNTLVPLDTVKQKKWMS